MNYLTPLKEKKNLTRQEATACLEQLLDETCQEQQIKETLIALSDKGETEEEILGFAEGLLSKAIRVPHHQDVLLEVCGTGGSGQDRFNISTAVAFLCASAGISVAKHGNVGSQKVNGSFDFLKALHIKTDQSPTQAAQQLDEKKLCFLFAKSYHPVLKKLGPIRKEIGKRSIFNLIGPLCNPANPTHQVLGCTQMTMATRLSQALIEMGREKVMVVVGEEGCDEVSFFGKTQIIEKTKKSQKIIQIHPEDFGIKPQKYNVGLADQNAALFLNVFSQAEASHPLAQHVALSAALPLYMLGKTKTIEDAFHLALKQIKEKKVYQKYQEITVNQSE